MCPQHDVLFEFLTVEEHILLFAQLKGAARADAENQAERMLSAFELLDRREYFAHGLSGGMKRKTCLAVALSGDTRLVILDEPTTGLDPGARRRVWDALGLLKSDRTIIMSTHFSKFLSKMLLVDVFLPTSGVPTFLPSFPLTIHSPPLDHPPYFRRCAVLVQKRISG
jgi:ABC-type multidrug transport system ATPase subunit